jgi:hypothetical protein
VQVARQQAEHALAVDGGPDKPDKPPVPDPDKMPVP